MTGYVGYLVQLGAAGAVIYVVILFLRFLEKQRKQNDEHTERVFTKITDSSERNTEALTTSINGLTRIIEVHDQKTDSNIASCEKFREK